MDKFFYNRLLDLIYKVQVDGVKNVKVKASLISQGQEEKLVGEVVINTNVKKRSWTSPIDWSNTWNNWRKGYYY